MKAAAVQPVWWRLTPNPPCQPWCTQEHDEEEFSQVGELICAADLCTDPNHPVWVLQVSRFDQDATPGVVQVLPPTLRGVNLDDLEGHSPDAVKKYADCLVRAAEALLGASD